jgi:hypothetical protein
MISNITFSIPGCKIVGDHHHQAKKKLLSDLIPGKPETYIYNTEEEYYNEYKQSYFAMTTRKAGWDCMRHYEIVANGCLPFFPDFENCPPKTMSTWPKSLQLQVNQFYHECRNISHIDFASWNSFMDQFINHMRKHLTTRSIADYVVNKVGFQNASKILFLSGFIPPDYLRDLTLHGLKEKLGSKCHDFPMIPHIYTSYDLPMNDLWGKGFTYSRLLDPQMHDDMLDTSLMEDIKNKYYDLIIYGSYHRGIEMPLYDYIVNYYEPRQIILLCGGDIHECPHREWVNKGHCVFVREL